MKIYALALFFTYSGTTAYSVGGNGNGNSNTRRDVFQKTFAFGATAAAAAAVGGSPQIANALEQCPASANNCVRTKWTPPSGMSKADAAKAVKATIEAYPQEGQDDVDGGGWKIVDDNFGTGTATVEYRSSGKKFFAKAFNGGKPFVDDFKIEVEDSGVVQVFSSSRVGDSDFGVNAKRVAYFAAALKASGWSV